MMWQILFIRIVKILPAVSLLPYSGDKDYVQAPFCAVPYPNDILREYGPGSFFASGIIEVRLIAFEGRSLGRLGCSSWNWRMLLEVNLLKRSWANAAIKFAEVISMAMFENDLLFERYL